MEITQEIVRVFWEDGVKKGILFKNGHTEFFLLRSANNDQIDQLLGTKMEIDKVVKEK